MTQGKKSKQTKIIIIATKRIPFMESLLPTQEQIREHLINLATRKLPFMSMQIVVHRDIWNGFVKEVSKKATGVKYQPKTSIDLVTDLKSKPIIQILKRK